MGLLDSTSKQAYTKFNLKFSLFFLFLLLFLISFPAGKEREKEDNQPSINPQPLYEPACHSVCGAFQLTGGVFQLLPYGNALGAVGFALAAADAV